MARLHNAGFRDAFVRVASLANILSGVLDDSSSLSRFCLACMDIHVWRAYMRTCVRTCMRAYVRVYVC